MCVAQNQWFQILKEMSGTEKLPFFIPTTSADVTTYKFQLWFGMNEHMPG